MLITAAKAGIAHRWDASQRPLAGKAYARLGRIRELCLLDADKDLALVVVRGGVERECKFDSFNEETWRVWVRGADPKRPESISLCDPFKIMRVGA